VDEVVPEPPEGAQNDWDASARTLGDALRKTLASLSGMTPRQWVDERYEKFRRMGSFFAEAGA